MADELDYAMLNRELDRVKTKVFLGNNAAFLGPLMCGMDFIWDESEPTAWTDGITIGWNPHWFLKLPSATRATVLVHELWHPAYLHLARIGDRQPKEWNWACDIVINNGLEDDGFTFEGTSPWKDQKYRGWNAEAIYDDLIQNQKQTQCAPWGPGGPDDLDIKLNPQQQQQAINNVIQAAHSAKMAGKPGHVPGHIQEIIKNFLKPRVKWDVELQRFMTELLHQYYSWRRPRRRTLSQGLYLPTRIDNKDRLQHLCWYFDVSGSVGDDMLLRFFSETAYVWKTFKPKKMTIIMFDTEIKKIIEFEEGQKFDDIKVIGRGGTDFRPVRQHIMDTKPNAAVIYSDMECAPMEPGPTCPILWVAIAPKGTKVKVGKLIHVRP